jgi:Mn2+/Fe2+ NRAMP family transporter
MYKKILNNIFLYTFFIFHPLIVQAQLKEWNEVEGCMIDGVPTLKCLEVVFSNLLFLSSAFVILVLFSMLIIGAFTYLTSFGNPEKVKKAQGIIRWAITGLIIFLASYLILKIIDVLFLGGRGDIFKFEIPS